MKEVDNNERNVTLGWASQRGRAMKMKMAHRLSLDNNFQLKFKARLVACGYSQIYGLDFKETFAPTPSVMVINLVLHVIAHLGLHVGSFDVAGAFLESTNDYEQYGWLPPVILGQRLKVRLLKAQYGERQELQICGMSSLLL